ncbi:MAG: CCR4-NOT transcription complex subunit 4 [Paramarteilia canceri]
MTISQRRIIQPNLLYILGLPLDIDEKEVRLLVENFGEVTRLTLNRTSAKNYLGHQTRCASAHVTFALAKCCLHSLVALQKIKFCGRALKCRLGSSKYCEHFLAGRRCPRSSDGCNL